MTLLKRSLITIAIPTVVLFLLMMFISANRLKFYATQQTQDALISSSDAASEYVMGAMQKPRNLLEALTDMFADGAKASFDENLRIFINFTKLQENTDTTDGGKDLTEPAKNISKEEAEATQNYAQNSTSTNYRIKGFYGFKGEKSAKKFSFGMIFSFILRKIAEIIKMRLIVIYKSSRLRNLEDMSPQSVPCECKTEDSRAKTVTPQVETDIDYNCTADKAEGFEVGTVKLDANYPMQLDDETVEFTNIYLDEDAQNQAKNIQQSEGHNLFTVQTFDEKFNIKGTTKPNATFLESYVNQVINLIFTHKSGSSRRRLETSEKPCTVQSSNEIQCEGEVDGKITKIETSSDNYNLTFVPQSENTYPTSPKSDSNSAVYRKSSSGLSGGAIAGIVIACVVVLIAAAVAAIMLRKPTPPVDNTTVVDLKQDNI